MRIKVLFITVLALLLSPLALGPAAAEPEPDGSIWQASGPVMDGQIRGSIASGNDDDWFMFYAASQTQLTITIQPNSCRNGMTGQQYAITLRNSRGDEINSRSFSSSVQTMTYTTPTGTNQYFINVWARGLSCPSNPGYSASISPVSSLVWGSPMPTATTPTGEPNESAAQAQGPIWADTVYTGALETSNDQDWFAFWANGAFMVQMTESRGCGGDYAIYDSQQRYVAGDGYTWNWFSQSTYTPSDWGMFYLKITGDCAGSGYRFSLWPSSSIQAGPKPLPVAGGIPWAKYRKSSRSLVVYWPAATNATSYWITYRIGAQSSRTVQTANTWLSFPRKAGKRGLYFSVTATAPGGAGPVSNWRIKY